MSDKYAKQYFDLIRSGLDQTIVTESGLKTVSADKGIHMWAERAARLKDYSNGLIFFCGNGASASMAEHMSHDWFQNARVNTYSCAEISHVTAISNDISYDEVYSYRVNRILTEHDILVGISSSGNSQNIINAIRAAKEKKAFTITVSGMRDNNKLRTMGDLNFYVPLHTYGEVESAHAVLLHAALDYYLDNYMGGRH